MALGVAHAKRNIALADTCSTLLLNVKSRIFISVHHMFCHARNAGNECAEVAACFGTHGLSRIEHSVRRAGSKEVSASGRCFKIASAYPMLLKVCMRPVLDGSWRNIQSSPVVLFEAFWARSIVRELPTPSTKRLFTCSLEGASPEQHSPGRYQRYLIQKLLQRHRRDLRRLSWLERKKRRRNNWRRLGLLTLRRGNVPAEALSQPRVLNPMCATRRPTGQQFSYPATACRKQVSWRVSPTTSSLFRAHQNSACVSPTVNALARKIGL